MLVRVRGLVESKTLHWSAWIKMLVRVHGVVSREEAIWLEALGVDLISVAMGESASMRTVNRQMAHHIAKSLGRARLCIEPSAAMELAPEEAHGMGASIVAIPWGREVTRAWRVALANRGLEWAQVRIPADEDDDPSWVESRIEEAGAPRPAWVEVEICPNLENGWSLIRAPHESELDAVDLDGLARRHAILYSADFRPDHLRSICEALPHAKGLSFTLGRSESGVPGAHRYGKEELRRLLEELQRMR
jgi:hypothetical protein